MKKNIFLLTVLVSLITSCQTTTSKSTLGNKPDEQQTLDLPYNSHILYWNIKSGMTEKQIDDIIGAADVNKRPIQLYLNKETLQGEYFTKINELDYKLHFTYNKEAQLRMIEFEGDYYAEKDNYDLLKTTAAELYSYSFRPKYGDPLNNIFPAISQLKEEFTNILYFEQKPVSVGIYIQNIDNKKFKLIIQVNDNEFIDPPPPSNF